MKVVVSGVDITKYINESSYKMNSTDVYQSWIDGNFIEHRIYTRTKITGSFTIALYGQEEMGLETLRTIWNRAVNNNVVTINVYVSNLGVEKRIEAYFTMNIDSHRKISEGRYLDLIDITLEEK